MDLKQTIIMLLHDVVAKVFDIASELNIHVRRKTNYPSCLKQYDSNHKPTC